MIGYFVVSRAIRQRNYDDAVAEFLAQEVRIVRPGLSDAALLLHPTIAAPEPAKGEPPENCSVCMEALAPGQPCRQLMPCRHIFHVECADTWLGRSTVCPMCRGDLRTADERTTANAALAEAAARFEQRTGLQPRPHPTAGAVPVVAVHAPAASAAAAAPAPAAAAAEPTIGGASAPAAGGYAGVSVGIELVPLTPPVAAESARQAAAGGGGGGGSSSASSRGALHDRSGGGAASARSSGQGPTTPPMSARFSRPPPPSGSARAADGPEAAGGGGGGGGGESNALSTARRHASNASRVVTPTTISVLGTVHADGGFLRGEEEADTASPLTRASRYSNPLAPPPRMAGQAPQGRTNNADAPLTRHVL